MKKFISKVPEVVEVSQLDYIGSGNKLQWQKTGPLRLGEEKAKAICLGGEKEKTQASSGGEKHALRLCS